MTNEVIARTPREEAILKRAGKLGLTIQPVGNKGAVLVRGREVDLMAATLGWIELRDLNPFRGALRR